jgi:hypothetical protein
MKFVEFFEGKKQYITAIAIGVCAGLEAYGISIPEYVYAGLAAFGIYANRSALAKAQTPSA